MLRIKKAYLHRAHVFRLKCCRYSNFHFHFLFLFQRILQDAQKPLNFRYDFIFDRCRAVRQEIVIQSLSCEETIILMEPIALFLSYSLYKMFEYPIAQFDTKICRQHLQECLLTCLGCYEEVDVQCMKGSYKIQNREIIESIYMMLNMNETSSLERALKLDIKLKASFIIGKSIEVLISYQQRAFYKTVKHISKLPHPIICAVAALRLPEIRKEMLHVFSIAYNSSSLKVPLDFLQRLLVYDKSSTLLKHLRENLGIHDSPDSDDAIRFDRKKFDSKKTLVSINRSRHSVQTNEFNIHVIFLPCACISNKFNIFYIIKKSRF